jgi:hypothetical protein
MITARITSYYSAAFEINPLTETSKIFFHFRDNAFSVSSTINVLEVTNVLWPFVTGEEMQCQVECLPENSTEISKILCYGLVLK